MCTFLSYFGSLLVCEILTVNYNHYNYLAKCNRDAYVDYMPPTPFLDVPDVPAGLAFMSDSHTDTV